MDKPNVPGIELVSEGNDKRPTFLRFLKVQQDENGLKSGSKEFVIWQRHKSAKRSIFIS